MAFDNSKTKTIKNFYLIGLTRDEDLYNDILDSEFVDNTFVVIFRKRDKDSKSVEYIRCTVEVNDKKVNITKEIEDNITKYELIFKKIIDKYYCEVSSSGKKVAFYEFDTDFLANESATYSDIINYVDYSNDKQRGR